MISLDVLEALAINASVEDGPSVRDWQDYCRVTGPAYILDLIAEVRRLRARSALADSVSHYADSVCGMLRQGGWPGKAEALESRIKAVIDFDKESQ
jgi:hypothetical protein